MSEKHSEMNSSTQSRRLGAHGGTPESEFSNFECFQNYTAPEVFVQGLAGIVNQGDVEMIIRAQKQMLQRFEKTNEMLLNCNALSAGRLKIAGEDFKKHTKLLNDMKKDLDYIFKKIRVIRTKVSNQYPDAFADAQPQQRCSFAEECEDDEDVAVAAAAAAAAAVSGAAVTATPTPTTSQANQSEVPGGPSTSRSTKAAGVEAGSCCDIEDKKTKVQKKRTDSKESGSSVDYVQMKHSPDNGQSSGELDKRRSLGSAKSGSTDNSNESSDSDTA